MKDYFRRQGLSFKYNPIFWLLRLFFVYLMVTTGRLQWLIILFGTAFSIGFVQNTEMEHMLPMSEEEIIKQKLTKVGFIWLRYLVIGLIGRVYIFLAGENGWYGYHDYVSREMPILEISFFVLIMVYAYELMLDAIREDKGTGLKEVIPRKIYKYFIQTLPHFIFFFYAVIMIMSAQERKGVLKYGDEWMHAAAILAAAVLLTINILIERKSFKTTDYRPADF